MVGVMVAVGTGKMTIDDIHSLVNHPEKGTMSRLHKLNLHIPPHGLYLKEVHYKKQGNCLFNCQVLHKMIKIL